MTEISKSTPSAAKDKTTPTTAAPTAAPIASENDTPSMPPLDTNDPWISFLLARRRISGILPPTMLMKGNGPPLRGIDMLYKCDHMRATGSFKERGALNALLSLTPEQKRRGVVAASAGNHALALAYHGRNLGIPIVVVMPTNSPLAKSTRCRTLGAAVFMEGRSIFEARKYANILEKERGLVYINGYDHPDVIAGAGTCGLEILEQCADVDVIVVPVGGGGLLAGISYAVKRLKPTVKVIGVESVRCPSMSAALAAGRPVYTPVSAGGTIADGLAVPVVGINAFNIVRSFVDRVVAIEEHFISSAIVHALEMEKMLLEGAGACGLAGILSGKLDDFKSLRVVTVLCGGNIDLTVLGRVIERGLYSTGRLMQYDCAISDRVGGLARFTQCLASSNASVKEIVQERPFISDVNVCSVHLTLEIASFEHAKRVVEEMRAHGFQLIPTEDKYQKIDLSKL